MVLLIGTLFVLTCFQSFTGIATQEVERWDEQTNIDVVNESYTAHSFPFLVYKSEPFFEKPPLWYYIEYVLVSFGYNTLSSFRIVSSFSGILFIVCTAYLAKRFWGNIAFLVTWIVLLLSRQLFVTNIGGQFSTHTVRSADVDALLILFLMIAVLVALCKKPTNTTSVMTGIFIGLSMITKGPSGFIILLPFSVWFFSSQKKSQVLMLWGSALAVCVPWFLLMLLTYGYSFWNSFFTYHIGSRTFSAIEGHNQSFFYYITLLGNPLIYPPGILLIFSIAVILFKKLFIHDKRLGIILLCFLFYMTVPSLLQTKLAWYVLPVYPFAALLIGYVISRYRTFSF